MKRKKTTVESSIAARRKIAFTYDGKKRVAEAHVLGETGGTLQVLAYQDGAGWRRFDVDKMKNITPARGKFKTRDDGAPYAPFDQVIKVVK